MNKILQWLSGGDLRSDGMSNEIAEFILENPQLLDELIEGLNSSNDVIRGRTADALEKIAREKPELFVARLSELIQVVTNDNLPMVKMHLAMMLGHLVVCGEKIDEITEALINLLDDESAYAKSWAIVSLCIVAKKYPDIRKRIFNRIVKYQNDKSIAIRTRVRKAIDLLGKESSQFPKGWIKSKYLQDIERC